MHLYRPSYHLISLFSLHPILLLLSESCLHAGDHKNAKFFKKEDWNVWKEKVLALNLSGLQGISHEELTHFLSNNLRYRPLDSCSCPKLKSKRTVKNEKKEKSISVTMNKYLGSFLGCLNVMEWFFSLPQQLLCYWPGLTGYFKDKQGLWYWRFGTTISCLILQSTGGLNSHGKIAARSLILC